MIPKIKKLSKILGASFVFLLGSCQSKMSTQMALHPSDHIDLLLVQAEDHIPYKNDGHLFTSEDRMRLERHYPLTLEKLEKHQRLSLQDVKNMTRAGVSDKVIIHEIHLTQSIFYLTPDDEDELAQSGVSYQVIDAMKETTGVWY